MKSKAQSNRFLRVISLPYRALCKARDFYVDRVIDCTNSNVVGIRAASQAPGLPKSFSRASSSRSEDSEDFRELVRAASTSWRSTRLEAEMKMRAVAGSGAGGGGGEKWGLPPRSVSVGMGRIDEERPWEDYGALNGPRAAVNGGEKKDLKYPRSKSHAAVVRTAF